jgi:hypothetical protein
MTAHGTAVFGEAVRMVGDALGIKLDEVRCDAEYPIMTATHRCAIAAAAPGIVHLQRRAADPAARRRGTHLTGPTGTATMR